MNELQSELAIIHNEISNLTGYDDGLDCLSLKGQPLTIKRNTKLAMLKLLLRSRAARLRLSLAVGNDVKEELEEIQRKIKFFDDWN